MTRCTICGGGHDASYCITCQTMEGHLPDPVLINVGVMRTLQAAVRGEDIQTYKERIAALEAQVAEVTAERDQLQADLAAAENAAANAH